MFYVAPAVLDTRDASDVALPLQDLTVLWMTKKREREEESDSNPCPQAHRP